MKGAIDVQGSLYGVEGLSLPDSRIKQRITGLGTFMMQPLIDGSLSLTAHVLGTYP